MGNKVNVIKNTRKEVLSIMISYLSRIGVSIRLPNSDDNYTRKLLKTWLTGVHSMNDNSLNQIIDAINSSSKNFSQQNFVDSLVKNVSKNWNIDESVIKEKIEDKDFESILRYFFIDIIDLKYQYELVKKEIDINKYINVIKQKFNAYFNNYLITKIDNKSLKVRLKYYYSKSSSQYITVNLFLWFAEINNITQFDSIVNSVEDKSKTLDIVFPFGNVIDFPTNMIISQNIYVENIEINKLKTRFKLSEKYVYDDNLTKSELIEVNLFLDEVIRKTKGYEHIFLLNALLIENNKTELSLLPYEAKRITQSVINFEREIFKKILNTDMQKDQRKKNIVILGELTVSLNLHSNQHINNIIVLSDSVKYVDWLKKKISQGNLKKIKVFVFYSGIANYILDKANLYKWADYVFMSGGYASELRNINKYLRVFSFILKDTGKLFISFYENDGLSIINSDNDISKSLNYVYSSKNKTIHFNNKYIDFKIPSYSAGINNCCSRLEHYFCIDSIYRFPEILLINNNVPEEIYRYFEKVDRRLSIKNLNKSNYINYSYYGIYVCSKDVVVNCVDYDYIINKYKLEVIRHKTVYNKSGHFKALFGENKQKNSEFELIKTIYVYNDKAVGIILTTKNKMLPEKNIGHTHVDCYDNLKLMNEKKINKVFGKNIGNLSPFFNNETKIDFYLVDEELMKFKYLYVGSDSPNISYCFCIKEFKKFINDFKMKEIHIS